MSLTRAMDFLRPRAHSVASISGPAGGLHTPSTLPPPCTHAAPLLPCTLLAFTRLALTLLALTLIAAPLHAQETPPPPSDQPTVSAVFLPPRFPRAASSDVIAVTPAAITALLDLQEDELGKRGTPDANQWPYEGVYRTRGSLPVGYRIGGTCIVILALTSTPGYEQDNRRVAAVERAITYICSAREHADMSTQAYDGGYDVRIWGNIEALHCLAHLERKRLIPQHLKLTAKAALEDYLDAVVTLEMPATGGWNYARPAGKATVGAPASFVTACALQALLEARAAGYTVDSALIDRGVAVLEKSRGATGTIVYSGPASERTRISDSVPGATGRMTLTESTLMLVGKGSIERVRAALDAFITHWDWLDQRRAKTGTHVPPYMVAPYYFMFAHRYAAQAIEHLPKADREEYRARINGLLMSVKGPDTTWNDRVFPRSAGYGTAMALLAIHQPAQRSERAEEQRK